MLHKKFRLPSHLIPQILKKGKRFYFRAFTLIINHQSPSNNQESRFVFIVPKKFDKRAVKRNQLKRWMREAGRVNLAKIKKGYNIVLIASQRGRRNSLFQIKIELQKILNKAGLLKPR